MELKYSLYIHEFPNDKVYIGITNRKVERRWGREGSNYKNSKRIYNAILKYGWNNIKHIVLYEGLTKEEAQLREIDLIKQYDSTNKKFGYNTYLGGDLGGLGYKHTEEEKQKIKDALKTSYPHRGKKLTLEHREKLSIAHLGQVAWNKGLKGFKQSEETINKRKKTMIDRYGSSFVHKKEYKSVLQIDKENNLVVKIWKSVYDAQRYFKVSSSIFRCCESKKGMSKGFVWKYLEDVMI